jgi:hypothetical protein
MRDLVKTREIQASVGSENLEIKIASIMKCVQETAFAMSLKNVALESLIATI